jgi:hypothetical protein
MADIDVASDGGAFRVTVAEGESTTEHLVTVSEDALARLGSGYPNSEALVRASFEFLLAREPKEQILPEFDLDIISRYFPEFEREIAR